MHGFTPLSSLLGGALIGLAISLVLLTHGRAAGISGLWAGVLRPSSDRTFRVWFFAGLIGAGLVMRAIFPQAFGAGPTAPLGLIAVAGLLVGYGTRLGGGCTSGHGVCGNSRLEARSIAATVTFMLTGALAVFALRALS
ncbi:MAG: YeeE/YedE family protein [Archangiaceae bacterium]|nr:YeeE/YedE family protein [Archangiaceae bacterium]